MSCCSNNKHLQHLQHLKMLRSRVVPLKRLRPLAFLRSSDEKLLSRVLGKFDVGTFFFGKGKDDSLVDDILFEVLISKFFTVGFFAPRNLMICLLRCLITSLLMKIFFPFLRLLILGTWMTSRDYTWQTPVDLSIEMQKERELYTLLLQRTTSTSLSTSKIMEEVLRLRHF